MGQYADAFATLAFTDCIVGEYRCRPAVLHDGGPRPIHRLHRAGSSQGSASVSGCSCCRIGGGRDCRRLLSHHKIPLRYLGFIGDLLTGPILGCVYMLAILVPAKYLFHDDELQTRGDWLTALAFGGGFGVVGTIVYWYQSWRERKGR